MTRSRLGTPVVAPLVFGLFAVPEGRAVVREMDIRVSLAESKQKFG